MLINRLGTEEEDTSIVELRLVSPRFDSLATVITVALMGFCSPTPEAAPPAGVVHTLAHGADVAQSGTEGEAASAA
jgi:hypothetical protein